MQKAPEYIRILLRMYTALLQNDSALFQKYVIRFVRNIRQDYRAILRHISVREFIYEKVGKGLCVRLKNMRLQNMKCLLADVHGPFAGS